MIYCSADSTANMMGHDGMNSPKNTYLSVSDKLRIYLEKLPPKTAFDEHNDKA